MEKSVRTKYTELRYSVTGEGPAVLSIQGVGVAGCGWRPQVDGLADRFTVITFDNCGIGHSPRGSHPLTIEQMALDALAVANAENVEHFHLLGHSMGGLIAQHVALTTRERVRSLSLVCTFASGADATRLSARMFVLGLRTRLGTRAMRRKAMLDMIMPREYLRGRDTAVLAERLGELFGRDLADQPPIVSEQLRAMSQYSAASRLRELSGIPTLVVSAAHDPIAPPRLGKALASAIGGARFVEFAHASHALPIQCAAELNALLVDHMAAAGVAGVRRGSNLDQTGVRPPSRLR
jgi:pimeloyl-ACP methyl ester carboxylesterase